MKKRKALSNDSALMRGVGEWTAYYRNNIDKFAEDYLHIRLKLFQRIVLVMMNICSTVVMIACRGIGKSFLSAVFCVCRCILYPGTKICIASGTRGQAINVLEKIDLELKQRSPELRGEINEKDSKTNGTNAILVFKNGSYIKVVTASDSARGNRANVLILDEARMIKKDVIDTILKNFLTQKRKPAYSKLTEEQREAEYNKEINKTIYLTSAYWSDSWIFQKCLDVFKGMMSDCERFFICGFPYQLALKEGVITRESIEEDMNDANFSEIKQSMEMGARFFGVGDDSFFDYGEIAKNRHIKYAMLPQELSAKFGGNNPFKIPPKQPGEIRILSADIALMSSKKNKNDASALFLNCMMPTKSGRYSHNITYSESFEGARTEEQGLKIRKRFDEFDCDYLVIDAQGVGSGVYDCISNDIVDPETGEIYPALSCCNNPEMAARCVNPNAPKVIWAIKASAQFNSDCAFRMRDGFKSGRLRLLVSEYDGEELLNEIKAYGNLNPMERVQFQLPYINTTLLIDEMVKLKHEDAGGGKVRLYERVNMRKDRYSSLSYNYYVATQIENSEARRKVASGGDIVSMCVIKPPMSGGGRAVSKRHGRFG